MNYTILKDIVAKPRFELNTASSSRIFATARGIIARYAHMFSFARCHDRAGAKIILEHGCGVGNTSGTGRSTSSAAQSTELKTLPKYQYLVFKARKLRTPAHSTAWTVWSPSRAEIAEPKAVARSRRSEWKALKRRSIAYSTPRTGWLTSRAEIAVPEDVVRSSPLE